MKPTQPRRQRVTIGNRTMKELTPKQRIEKLQFAIKVIRECQDENPELDYRDIIERAEDKLREAYKAAGWHCVSLIENGTATDVLFQGPHDQCTEYVSIWLEAHPEDKGNLLITPY